MSVLDLQSDADMEDDLSFLQPLDFITKDAYQLQKIVREKKDRMNAANNESKQESETEKARQLEEETKEEEEDQDDKSDKEKSNIEMEKVEPEENGTCGGNLRYPLCSFMLPSRLIQVFKLSVNM